jgi:hypothetical protein
VEVGRPADGINEVDTTDAVEPCDVYSKTFDTVEVVGMEERIVEFTAGEPPSVANMLGEAVKVCSNLQLYYGAKTTRK